MAGFDNYLAAVRELDAMRTAQAETKEHRAGQAATLGEKAHAIDEGIMQQRDAIASLAAESGVKLDLSAVGPMPGPDPKAELAAAEQDLEASRQVYAQARWMAHRPALFPTWRSDERNGLLYGAWAIAAIVAQLIVLRTSGVPDGIMQMLIMTAWLVGLPAAAFCGGWLSIGVVARPRMGEPEKLQRNPRLGAVICASTLVVACGLFT